MSPRRGTVAAFAAFAAALVLVAFGSPARATEVQRVVSPLGIEAWLVESDFVPVISMSFAFRGGIELDPDGKEGLAHLASTLLDEGAGPLDSAAFQQRLTDAAIQLSFGAGTDAFYGSLKTVTANADEAFELLRLALNEPRFDPEPVERMRAAVLADIRRRVADPQWMGRRFYYERAFPDHPYGRPSRGTAATLQGLTVEDLEGFVAQRFARDNLVIAVAGDIDATRLAQVLDSVFGGLPETSAAVSVADVVPQGAGERLLVRRDGPQSAVMLAQPGIGRDDPDYYAALVMNQVLGAGGLTSRLGLEVRERRGLTYGIASYLVSFAHADLLLVNSRMSNDNVAEGLAVTLAEWQRMAQEGATAEEVDEAKTYLTGSFPLGLTSTDEVAGVLRRMQLDNLGIDYIDRFDDHVAAVTPDDVNRVARTLLQPDALTIVVVGDPGDPYDPTATLDAATLAARELSDGGS